MKLKKALEHFRLKVESHIPKVPSRSLSACLFVCVDINSQLYCLQRFPFLSSVFVFVLIDELNMVRLGGEYQIISSLRLK